MKLDEGFYQRPDVVNVAKELLGKALFTRFGRQTTGGIIVETEAYSWRERGCHAYGNKKTNRNEIMFGPGGYAYVYLCYGIHNLFNIVTNETGIADAVLIRALEPIAGEATMKKRMKTDAMSKITSGPGKLTRALGIDRSLNGAWLQEGSVWVEDIGQKVKRTEITATKRVGIDYAGEDANLPWRFTLKDNRWISKA